MLGESNLVHLLLFASYLGILIMVAGNVRVKLMRNVSSMIQLTVLLLCIDLLMGFFLIERYYGGSESASWIIKSIYGLPVLLVVSLVWMYRKRKRYERSLKEGS